MFAFCRSKNYRWGIIKSFKLRKEDLYLLFFWFELKLICNLLKKVVSKCLGPHPIPHIVFWFNLFSLSSAIEVVDPPLSALITTKALDFGLWAFFVILTASRRLLIDSKEPFTNCFWPTTRPAKVMLSDHVALIFWVLIKNPSNVRYIFNK